MLPWPTYTVRGVGPPCQMMYTPSRPLKWEWAKLRVNRGHQVFPSHLIQFN